MKKLMLIFFAIAFSISYAQSSSEKVNSRLDIVGDLNSTGLWIKDASKSKIKGTLYLFDNWINFASIITGKGKTYNLKNINYDTKKNRFVTKTSPDSVFVFSSQTIRQVKVNNKIFKRYYVDGTYNYYELVAFGKGIEILKKSFKKIKKGKKDLFTSLYKQDMYVLRSDYFVNSKSGIKEIKMKKKSFLKLFEKQSKLIKTLISKNKLSIKKDSDLVKIFDYYKKI